jgi:hypothetical protein
MGRLLSLLAALVVATLAAAATAGTELVMFEEDGCPYCAAWDRQIAPIYPKTAEGRAAPLRRVDIHSDLPGDLTLKTRPVFTPTFVLVVDGVEKGRIEGYPGDEFFWFLLSDMMKKAGIDPAEAPSG